jgi:hypothetical protein
MFIFILLLDRGRVLQHRILYTKLSGPQFFVLREHKWWHDSLPFTHINVCLNIITLQQSTLLSMTPLMISDGVIINTPEYGTYFIAPRNSLSSPHAAKALAL